MAWEGAVARSGPNEQGTVGSQRFLSYRPISTEVDLDFVSYFFMSDPGMALLRKGSTGSVKRNQTLSPRTIDNFLIPLPSLEEQRRIAAILDRFLDVMLAIGKKRDSLERSIAPAMSRVLFGNEYSKRAIGELVELERYPIEVDPEHEYRYMGMRSFGKGIIRYPKKRGADLSKLRYFKFPSRALALSNIKAWEGAISVTTKDDTDLVASNRFLFYVPRRSVEIDVRFLCHYLLSEEGLAQVGAASPGSADRNRTLSQASFERIMVPVPPIDVQYQIADRLDQVRNRLGSLIEQRRQLEAALRPSLLNAAFGGEL